MMLAETHRTNLAKSVFKTSKLQELH